MFMFMAPLLYVIHALLTGLSLALTNVFGIAAGFGFSAGFFDMALNWGLATKPVLLVIMGLAYFGIYFGIFYTLIRVLDLKTPGREDETETAGVTVKPSTISDKAKQYLKAIGGHGNVENIDACITRLRLTLKDVSVVEDKVLTHLGASGVIRLGSNNIQIIVGPEAEIIAGEMKNIDESVDLSSIQLPTLNSSKSEKSSKSELANKYANLLGGLGNLTGIDACITRLRLTLKDTSLIDEAGIKALGAAAVVRIGAVNIQVVIGPDAELIADEMKQLMPSTIA